jgi:hypothetical protein
MFVGYSGKKPHYVERTTGEVVFVVEAAEWLALWRADPGLLFLASTSSPCGAAAGSTLLCSGCCGRGSSERDPSSAGARYRRTSPVCGGR